MAEEPVELSAKDVFVLLGVPIPENLEIINKWQDQGSKDDEKESHYTNEDDDKIHMDIPTDPRINVTPPEELDYSSSDSLTTSEIDEKRWYNPTSNTDLDKSDFDSLKELLESIKNSSPMETVSSLLKLRNNKITDESYQNMFITLNGFEVLINIIECNNDDCVREALIVIHEMSQQYGAQCSLCHLDVVNPLINILIFKKGVRFLFLAVDTLLNISKLRKGRKLIRLSGGVRILVHLMAISDRVFSTLITKLNDVDRTSLYLVNKCADILCLLCRSLKSQKDLWETGFTQNLLKMLSAKHTQLQISIMSLISECCRSRPNGVNNKTSTLYKVALKELNILPQIIKCMVSSSTELAAKAADTILSMLDDDPIIYDLLLENKGMDVVITAIKKFKNESRVMKSVITVLWKCSLYPNCREVMEKGTIVNNLLEMLTYPYDELVVAYVIATLSELWKCESLRGKLKQLAIPIYLQFLKTSLHSQILAHVCTALASASTVPDCMEMIDNANGFRLIYVLLPSLVIDEFDKYDDFYAPETIIAAAKCLTVLINHTPPTLNRLKGMFGALCDLVDLLTHTNPDILAETCRLVEVISTFEENLNMMIDAGVIENLAKLVPTTHTNLRANLCRALGKCCYGGMTARDVCCKDIVDQLFEYTESEHQIVKDNVSLALSGLSVDPLNCVKIEALGFIPYLKESMKSDNMETANAAVNCMRNLRITCTAVGQYHECSELNESNELNNL